MKKQLAVFGNPIKHSLSPQIHQQFASQHKLAINYRKLLSEPDQFADDVRQFFSDGGHGCNVTVPFKELAFQTCSRLTDQAKRAQAVNTLYVDSGELTGHNTDGNGLIKDLTVNLDLTVRDANVVILGAGGATRGILQPLIDQSPASLTIINRTESRAQQLADEFVDLFAINTLAADSPLIKPLTPDLLLNATSASLNAKLPVTDTSLVRPHTTCYDLAYASEPTRFLQWCKDCGSKSNHDGRGMLVEQAALAFSTWTGHQVDTDSIISNFEALKTQ